MTEPPSAESVALNLYFRMFSREIDSDDKRVEFFAAALRESARAARAAAIEECAKVVEAAREDSAAVQVYDVLARHIRALGPAAAKAEEKAPAACGTCGASWSSNCAECARSDRGPALGSGRGERRK